MQVPQLLLRTLDDLVDSDFKTFNWYLTSCSSKSYAPIPKSRLENAARRDTVSEMIQNYGEESAVNITVEILKNINNNFAAEKLKKEYAEGRA
ncbi:caspase b-like [Scomber scombrus]|uniref:Caspase b-like n=1 Tax=Scomber scombrus TaxID=13677 RepID=A0AAV1PP49_SCOSC